jgi:uncharacterized surface anchored protein
MTSSSCTPNRFAYKLPDTDKGCTWDGVTWSVDSDDSDYDAVLSVARFQLQDSTGAAALTLTSATAGEVTLNDTAAGQWNVTVEERILTLTAGTYTYALETQDANGVVKKQLAGTLTILPEPIK